MSSCAGHVPIHGLPPLLEISVGSAHPPRSSRISEPERCSAVLDIGAHREFAGNLAAHAGHDRSEGLGIWLSQPPGPTGHQNSASYTGWSLLLTTIAVTEAERPARRSCPCRSPSPRNRNDACYGAAVRFPLALLEGLAEFGGLEPEDLTCAALVACVVLELLALQVELPGLDLEEFRLLPGDLLLVLDLLLDRGDFPGLLAERLASVHAVTTANTARTDGPDRGEERHAEEGHEGTPGIATGGSSPRLLAVAVSLQT